MKKYICIVFVICLCVPSFFCRAANVTAELLSNVVLEDGTQFATVNVSVPDGNSDVTLVVIGQKDNGEGRRFSFPYGGKTVEGYIHYMEQAYVVNEKVFSIAVKMDEENLEDCIYVLTSDAAVKASREVGSEQKTLTVRVGQHGRVWTAGDEIVDGTVLTLPVGSIVSFEIFPDKGYVLDGVSLNGDLKVNVQGQFTMPPLQNDTLIAFSFWSEANGQELTYPLVSEEEQVFPFEKMNRYTPEGYVLLEYGLAVSLDNSVPYIRKPGCFSVQAAVNPYIYPFFTLSKIHELRFTENHLFSRPYAIYYSEQKKEPTVCYGISRG